MRYPWALTQVTLRPTALPHHNLACRHPAWLVGMLSPHLVMVEPRRRPPDTGVELATPRAVVVRPTRIWARQGRLVVHPVVLLVVSTSCRASTKRMC